MTKEDILHHFQDINFYYNDCMMYDDLSGMLDELIAENKGEWIAHEVGEVIGDYVCKYGDYTCSKCGHLINVPMWGFLKNKKFCENCGADMRGE